MSEINVKGELNVNSSNDDYENEIEVDYNRVMAEVHFIGTYPFATIVENITNQFNNYITTEDVTNYAEVFYNQLAKSYEVIYDEDDVFSEDGKMLLDDIKYKFTDLMINLFETRLFIGINDIEDISNDTLEFIIQRVYEYFILNAKSNFKTVIAGSINKMISHDVDDNEYFAQVQTLMSLFSPLITNVTPVEFLKLTGDVEVYNLFVNNKIVGNFLRKYTPKLYQNEIYSMEIVNYTSMIRMFKSELDATLSKTESTIPLDMSPLAMLENTFHKIFSGDIMSDEEIYKVLQEHTKSVLASDTQVLTADGIKFMGDLKSGNKILSTDKNIYDIL